MTQLKPLKFPNSSGHAMAFFKTPAGNAYLDVYAGGVGGSEYREYDPADDGPEVGTITRILATHKLYTPGKEGELLKFQHFVDSVARKMYGDRYGRLGLRRKGVVRRMVVSLHVDGFRPGSEFLITPSVLEP